jgi:hypothetical protein
VLVPAVLTIVHNYASKLVCDGEIEIAWPRCALLLIRSSASCDVLSVRVSSPGPRRTCNDLVALKHFVFHDALMAKVESGSKNFLGITNPVSDLDADR